jgi:mevalonate kinase
MKSSFYASAKLLLTGEYLVLKGAKALAVPLKKGQSLEVEEAEIQGVGTIEWEARVLDQMWFSAVFNLPDLEVYNTENEVVAINLRKIFEAIVLMRPMAFRSGIRYRFTTRSDFDHSWGFGSSSALIVNLARWAGLDPMELCFKVSGGSGYDVAVAGSTGPILYWLDHGKPFSAPAIFNPDFKNQIWFVYLGCKQDTRKGIAGFLSGAFVSPRDMDTMNELTEEFLTVTKLDDLMRIMYRHEVLLSGILKQSRIRLSMFRDFIGETKSLGAWGGDFAMVATPMPESYVRTYFSLKGLTTVFGFEELVLNNHSNDA